MNFLLIIYCLAPDWINVGQDKGQGWAVVNIVMNLRVP